MGSDTSPHVLRFTGFDHRRERRRLEYAFTHQRCGDGEVSGSGVSEGVSEAPTFTEWSTMVVPTYPEGVAATPCRCASTTIRLCEGRLLTYVLITFTADASGPRLAGFSLITDHFYSRSLT